MEVEGKIFGSKKVIETEVCTKGKTQQVNSKLETLMLNLMYLKILKLAFDLTKKEFI